MRTYKLYDLKFWRYLIVAPGFVMAMVFGSLYLPGFDVFPVYENQIYTLLFVILSMAIGIILGIAVSTYTYHINVSKEGLQFRITSPFYFVKEITKSYTWDEIGAYAMNDYGNGEILEIAIRNSADKYKFTNTMLKKSKDMLPFYEALQARAVDFNERSPLVKIGKLEGFYKSRFALITAWIIVAFLILIPILLIYFHYSNPGTLSGISYFKMIWFYLLGLIIVWNVWRERRKKDI